MLPPPWIDAATRESIRALCDARDAVRLARANLAEAARTLAKANQLAAIEEAARVGMDLRTAAASIAPGPPTALATDDSARWSAPQRRS